MGTLMHAAAIARHHIARAGRRGAAVLMTAAGVVLVSAGAAMIFFPAGLILAGLAIAGFGLFAVDVDEDAKA